MRPVCVHYGLDDGKDDLPESERAKRVIRILKDVMPNAPVGVNAEQVLGGLFHWVQQWAALPHNDDAKIVLMYDTGYRDERSAMITAACDPEAFVGIMFMAKPDEWKGKAS